jgi:two-component system, chemotaxis family, protein-glutamate methylesterase/glutaminase
MQEPKGKLIKILIADDSALAREVLTDLLQESRDLLVVGCACNGREAVELTLSLKPDLVIMDLLMPLMDGLEAIEEIMAATPTPVLVLSAAVEESEVDMAFKAIRRGALDVMEKPTADTVEALRDFAPRLIEKVKLLAGVRVIRHPRRKGKQVSRELCVAPLPPSILAIGASTGGPKAVMSLLRTLPANFSGAVFVVQHIAYGFSEGFASWLDRDCPLPVRLAADGARYQQGEVVIAPDGCHITVAEGRIRLTDEAPVNCCRPSIDVFFSSLAEHDCRDVVCLLLTGMGKDGARGLLRIKEQGGTTIVQDENSCAVFGMPKAAITLCAVKEVLPLESMPAAIARLFAAPASVTPD